MRVHLFLSQKNIEIHPHSSGQTKQVTQAQTKYSQSDYIFLCLHDLAVVPHMHTDTCTLCSKVMFKVRSCCPVCPLAVAFPLLFTVSGWLIQWHLSNLCHLLWLKKLDVMDVGLLVLYCRCVNVMTPWVGFLNDTQKYIHAFTNRTGQIVSSCSVIVALYDEEWQWVRI